MSDLLGTSSLADSDRPVMVVPAEAHEGAEALCGAVYAVVGYNGASDWSGLSGRKCIIWPVAEPQATQIAAVTSSLRHLPADRHATDFEKYQDWADWGKVVIAPYQPTESVQDGETGQPQGATSGVTPDSHSATPTESAAPQVPPLVDDSAPSSPAGAAPLNAAQAQAPIEVDRQAEYAPEPDAAPPTGDSDLPPLSAYQDEPETRQNSLPDHSWKLKRESNTDPDAWGVPMDFWGGVNLPPVDPACLPPAIVEFSTDQAKVIGCDPVQTALNCIVTCAAVVSEHVKLQCLPDSDWREAARVWGAVVGDASTKKGPAFDRCIGPLLDADNRFREANNAALAKYEVDKRRYEARLTDYIKDSRKDMTAQQPDAVEQPEITRLWTDDITKETVGILCAQNPRGRINLFKDELASWVGSFSAYSAQKGTEKDRGDWLSFYEGKPRYIDRATTGKSLYVPHFGGCILGGIQPSVISRLTIVSGSNVSMAEDGMLARFMVVNSKPAGIGEERRPDHLAKTRYTRIIENLINMTSNGLIRLAPDAQEYRADKARWINEMMRSSISPPLTSAIGKWEGLHMRLSLIYHLIDCADRGMAVADPFITLDNVARAWAWIETVVFPHAIYFYTTVLGNASEMNAFRSLANFILARDIELLTTSELSQHWSPFKDYPPNSAKRKGLFDYMEEGNWTKPIPTSSAGKMPTKHLVHPLVHESFRAEKTEAKRQRSYWAANIPQGFREKHKRGD